MAETKTKPTETSVESFIDAVDHPGKREDAKVLDALFRTVTCEEPRMWGEAMIGYGSYHYCYASGREGDWLRTGFSPRKDRHSIYLMGSYCDEETGRRTDELLKRLGKHARGKSCLYIKKLADVDMDVLEELISVSFDGMNKVYPPVG